MDAHWHTGAATAVALLAGALLWTHARPVPREGMTSEIRELRAELARLGAQLRDLVAEKAGTPKGGTPKGGRPTSGKSRAVAEFKAKKAAGKGKARAAGARDRGASGRGGASGRDASSGGESWRSGKMTYYWASEPDIGNGTGAIGAGGKRLVAKRSVAVKKALWSKYEGAQVEIEGMGVFSVDDYCVGGGCKDIDMYVGRTQGGHDGIKSIRYRFLSRK